MIITNKDIGYSIYSRLEQALRLFIGEKLINLFGLEWKESIPKNIWDKAEERSSSISHNHVDEPLILFEEIDFPDLMEIVCYKKAYSEFINKDLMNEKEFREIMEKLYEIRIKIAHIKCSFSITDLNYLIEISKKFLPILYPHEKDLEGALDCIESNPKKILLKMPSEFIIYEDIKDFPIPSNLPPNDYEFEGGFIGRKPDLGKIENLILGDLDRVITISGAGGVGKTALAHQFCLSLLKRKEIPFDGIVWISAKEEILTATSIEPIEPMFRNYEDLLDNILKTFGWMDDIKKGIEEKAESIQVIVQAGKKGILLVVDNLETIRDQRVIEFIKDIRRPSKVLITSRLGLGEVERRYTLKEMSQKDAVILFRTVSREKGVQNLVKLPDKIILKYVEKMSRYPLAIKWVIGQIAIGKNTDEAIGGLTSIEGDVSKFLFEHIFDNLLSDNDRIVLYSLGAYEKPLTKGVLTHVANLEKEELDNSLKNLTLASLIICTQEPTKEEEIETKYELIPLTRNFIKSKLQNNLEIHRIVMNRIEAVQHLIEEAERASKLDKFSMMDMGAKSEEEKIAARYAFVAYQKYLGGDLDEAIDTFKKASSIAPNFPAVYRNWAVALSNAGDYEFADKLMQKAASLDPKDLRIWFIWGNMEKQRNRLDKAYQYLKKALELSPEDAKILGAIGAVEIRRGNFKDADILLRKALKGEFQVTKRRHEIVCFTSISQNLRRWAEYLLKDRRGEEALRKLIEAYNFGLKAVKLAKDDSRAQDALRKACGDLGMFLLNKEGISNALPYFKKAIVNFPKRIREKLSNQRVCYYVTRAYLREENLVEAKEYYNIGNKALTPGSKFYEGYKQLKEEIFQERKFGKLYRVIQGEGYGFIELDDQQGFSIFIYYTEISPKVTLEEFEDLQGKRFSFTLKKDVKGYKACNAHQEKD